MRNASASSTTKVGHIVGGSALVSYGLLKGGVAGYLAAAAGTAIAAAGITSVAKSAIPEAPHSSGDGKPTLLQTTISVDKMPVEAYQFWRQLNHLPQFLSGLSSVETGEGGRHTWTVRGTLGLPIRWETEIVNDQPGRILEWKSVEGSPIRSAGVVRFKRKQNGRGTKIHVQLSYVPVTGFSAEQVNRKMSQENFGELKTALKSEVAT